MQVFLLQVCAFKKDFDNLGNAYDYHTEIFYDLTEAIGRGKKILDIQINEYFEALKFGTHHKKLTDEFIDDWIDYIFHITEFEPEKQKIWVNNKKLYSEIENPYQIRWEFDHKGNLESRWFAGKETDGEWDFRPGDESPDAGTRFKVGDIVCAKNGNEKVVGVVCGTPLKEGKYFENNYTFGFIDSGYINHFHPHESDIEIHDGIVSEPLSWLSKYFKGEIKISDEDSKKIFSSEIAFFEEPIYKSIKKL